MTEDLPLNKLGIFSDKGTYDLFFNISDELLREKISDAKAVIIDRNVMELYEKYLHVNPAKCIIINALEEKKTPEESLSICQKLLALRVKRKERIVAIGGGITQDLVTFAASILFRGIEWIFIPTTLLAQSDSCIGGKSSLNFASWKNILGNFYPPIEIIIQDKFLQTLTEDDIRSGIGEIFKVHLLSGTSSVQRILQQFQMFQENGSFLNEMTYSALELKNRILEIDPLDTGLRLKMNYGHSFGHALESATHFCISHGIAVTIGLDIANYMANMSNRISKDYFNKIHQLLVHNLREKDFVAFNFDDFIQALRRDKKNSASLYRFVIPIAEGEVELIEFNMHDETDTILQNYFNTYYRIET